MIDRGGIDARLAETGPLMSFSASHIDEKVAANGEVRRSMHGPVQPVLERLNGSFREYLISLGLSPKTINTYTKVALRFVRLAGSCGIDLMTASPSDVAAVMSLVPDTPSTRRMYRSSALQWWSYMGHPDPPVKAIRVPRPPRAEFKGLEPEEARALTETATGWFPEGTAVLFGLYLALRREEIASVRWDRFDAPLEWYTVHGKGNVVDTLPVNEKLAAELKPTAYRWCFPGRDGRGHVTGATVGVWVDKVAKAAGVRKIHPHMLRHTAIATINDTTGDLRAAQAFARHTDPTTTARYTRATEERLRRASASLDY